MLESNRVIGDLFRALLKSVVVEKSTMKASSFRILPQLLGSCLPTVINISYWNKIGREIFHLTTKCQMTYFLRSRLSIRNFSHIFQNGVDMDWSTKGDPVVHFQHLPGNDTVQVYLRVSCEKFNVNRTFNFSRKVAENIDAFIGRVCGNLEKELAKRNKKKKLKGLKGEAIPETPSFVPEDLKVVLRENQGAPLEGITVEELLNRIVANDQPSYFLEILGQLHRIKLNAPWVANLQMPSSILAGYRVYPQKLETLFCSKDDLDFIWYRGVEGKDVWTEVGRGYSYLAQNEDVNFRLKIKAVPRTAEEGGNLEFERTANCTVQAGPGLCPFEERHLFTPDHLTGSEFRVISYNILADLYANSDYSRDVLFGYCQNYALNMDYRKHLFTKEITGYHGDIICLQEVDAKLFDSDLVTIFGEEQNYSCHFAEKRDVGEGVAILFRKSRFSLLDTYKFDVGDSIKNGDAFRDVNEKLQGNERLFARVVERSTTLLVVVLRSIDDPKQVLIVANTHLYFHPDADHIRLLQAGMSVSYVEKVVLEEVKRRHAQEADHISLVFCGDFNSDPKSGIFELMTTGRIPTDHKDWGSSKWSRWKV